MENEVKNQIVLSESEIKVRELRLTLKGFIIQYSINHGAKWESKRTEISPAFEAGRKLASSWSNDIEITCAHILHNRIRHNRQHTSDDASFISKNSYMFRCIEKKFNIDQKIMEDFYANKNVHNS